MLEIRERADTLSSHSRAEGPRASSPPPLTLTLPFELRQRSRQRVRLSSGDEAALLLTRGTVLRGGDDLKLSDGRAVRVEAAPESVSTVRSDDAQKLARVAYHLGNRHVPLEVGAGYVRYLHDHVLDEMVRALGLAVLAETAPFEPESGAYGGGSTHSHAHGHSHGHDHHHDHDHSHEQRGER
ncbi:MAG: urease accessory protein UreE [Polyangiales bacterium]